ncbi:dipeptidase PepE [Alteromonas facilis]|uniref:dipeptidase PepE n=1 Tax=Alteromonas facilis TaxID=2048004 RepID=UPI000C28B6EF|nr:dipeptidase PepE [Alteromonas facilis]
MHHVLMLSSSRAGNEEYLAHARPLIDDHLSSAQNKVKHVCFIPYAGVSISYDDYCEKVSQALPHISITGIHSSDNPKAALQSADAVLVGGGNTFHLLHQLYQYDLLTSLQQRVESGMPYVGWSAGSNICGLSIRTTNDMPIIEPKSFNALGFVNAQLNPHYTDYQPPNHNGETRDERLFEFTQLNPQTPVLAIREGTALVRTGNRLTLQGSLDGFVFTGSDKSLIKPGDDLSDYLQD